MRKKGRQPGRFASIAATSAGSPGSVRGRNLAMTAPSGPTRNFSKFHWMEMVGPAPEPENAVLTDDARLVRWAGPAFVLFSLSAAGAVREAVHDPAMPGHLGVRFFRFQSGDK